MSQGQRFCHLREQPVLVLDYSCSKTISYMSVWNLSCYNLCPLLLVFSLCSSEKTIFTLCMYHALHPNYFSELWTVFHLFRSVVFAYSKLIVIFQVCTPKCRGNNHLPQLASTLLLIQPRRWSIHCQLRKTNCLLSIHP